MIADLALPVELRMGPTYREPDGLAMSSRNRYLDPAQRRQAPALHGALDRLRQRLRDGVVDFARVAAEARVELERAGLKPDYVEIRRRVDLGSATSGRDEERVVLGAAWLGRARLIDNLFV
jgi:pantoate--beta-alanine ligase